MHRIDRIRGVWADNQYYWADELRSARKLESVEVRIEPWNANVIYVHFRGRWIPAIARDLRPFAGRTYYEVQLALRAERRAAKVRANGARQSKLSAKKMVGLWEPAKFDPRIAVQQREATYLYERLGMTVAMALPELVRHADQTPVSALDSTEKAPAAVSAQANFCPSIPSLPQGALTDVSARSVPSSTESMTPTANEPAETHEPQADTDAESIWGESNEFV